jgi:hypothetical protein
VVHVTLTPFINQPYNIPSFSGGSEGGSSDGFDLFGAGQAAGEFPADPDMSNGPTAGGTFDVRMLSGFFQAFSAAVSALALPDCAKHFGKAPLSLNPAALLTTSVLSGGPGSDVQFGTTDDKRFAAVTNWRGIEIVTSDPWAYYSSDGTTRIESTRVEIDINVGVWNGESTTNRAQELIHELGHAFNMLVMAGGSDFVYDAKPDASADPAKEAINAQIMQDCIQNAPTSSAISRGTLQ